MRRAAWTIATLLLLLLWVPQADAATKRERKRVCAQRGFTDASSAAARVFEVDRGGDRSLYGCLRANGRLQLLSNWFSCDCSIADETGPYADLYAGYFVLLTEYTSCGPFPTEECEIFASYTLRNLKSKREVSPQDDVSQVAVGKGFFAYEDGRVVIVRGGKERVVDPGPGIEPGSLAIAGKRLYWTRDGLPQSAQ